MNCQNCGIKVGQKSKYCPNCGATIANNTDITSKASVQKRRKWFFIVPLCVILSLAILFTYFSYCFRGYEKIIRTYFVALENLDYETITKTMFDDEYLEAYLEFHGYSNKNEYIEKKTELAKNFGFHKADFDWKIKQVENLNRLDKLKGGISEQYNVSNMNEFQDLVDSVYEMYGLKEGKIQNAYAMKLQVNSEIDDKSVIEGNEEDEICYVIVYKYQNSWFIWEPPYGWVMFYEFELDF